MRRFAAFFLVLLVAVLPLRGFAMVGADPCMGAHGSVGVEAPAHAGAAGHGCDHAVDEAPALLDGGHDDKGGHASCAYCVACAAGCGVPLSIISPSLDVRSFRERIPFRPYHAGAHVPALPDRPPLSA